MSNNISEQKWNNYIKDNSSGKYYTMDCQLVSTINAYYHLTGNIIEQGSWRYRRMAKECGCKAGACIDITKAWKSLGIWENERIDNELDLKRKLHPGCFFEVKIWHKKYGLHSCTIVDHIEKADCIRVTNLKYLTSTKGWMFFEDLKPHITLNPQSDEPRYIARDFKLKENKYKRKGFGQVFKQLWKS